MAKIAAVADDPSAIVPYYLSNGRDKSPIELERKTDRITVIRADEDERKWEMQTLVIAELAGVAIEPRRLLKKIWEIEFARQLTLEKLTDMMEKARKRFPDLIFHHVYIQKGNPKSNNYYLTDEIIVTFESSLSFQGRKDIQEKFKLIELKNYDNYKYLPKNTYVFKVTRESEGNPIKTSDRIRMVNGVLDAVPNLVRGVNLRRLEEDLDDIDVEPADVAFKKQWHLNAFDHADFIRSDAGVEAGAAWKLLKDNLNLDGGDPNVVIAIIDYAFRVTHDAYETRLVKGFEDFDFIVSDRNNAFSNPNDSHGTRCVGVALARDGRRKKFGIAYGCSFLPVKIPQEITDTEMVEILSKVAEVADVISYSNNAEPSAQDPIKNPLLTTLTEIAATGGRRGLGCVLCYSAGNYNFPINEDISPDKPLTYCTFRGIPQPPYFGVVLDRFCAHPSIMAIAASTSISQRAPYSNYGKEISVCAPSDNYGACDKRSEIMNRKGPGIWTTDLNKPFTDRFGGTSSAAPLVAGIAALVISANPELTGDQVRKILEDTADKINLNLMDANHPGIYRPKNNNDTRLHSIWYGYGKVNAAKAVAEALRMANH